MEMYLIKKLANISCTSLRLSPPLVVVWLIITCVTVFYLQVTIIICKIEDILYLQPMNYLDICIFVQKGVY